MTPTLEDGDNAGALLRRLQCSPLQPPEPDPWDDPRRMPLYRDPWPPALARSPLKRKQAIYCPARAAHPHLRTLQRLAALWVALCLIAAEHGD